MINHPNTLSISSFKGLENVSKPEHTALPYLKKAENINLDKSGKILKRKGYIKVDSANFTSLWASKSKCYAVRNGDLVKINPDYSFNNLLSDIGDEQLSFEEVDDLIYYSSTNTNGVIDNEAIRSFGIEKNVLGPTLSTTSNGNLPEGNYLISFTYVSDSGREGGCSVSSSIQVSGGGGIHVFIPSSTNPSISFARVYSSTPDGTDLFFAGLAIPGTTFTVSSTDSLIQPIRTFGVDRAPLGQIVKYYRGRLYIAQDNVVWYSDPFQYERFRLNSNYIEFPDYITDLMPVEDGIWVGSDKIYYLSGVDAKEFKRSVKEEVKIIKGTPTKISGSYIHLDNVPSGYKWLVTTNLGVFALFNQGFSINLTSQFLSVESANEGSSIFLQDSGLNQYLSMLKTNSNPNNSVIGDLVETSIVRNGVTLP